MKIIFKMILPKGNGFSTQKIKRLNLMRATKLLKGLTN
jgi:hypothetical protein